MDLESLGRRLAGEPYHCTVCLCFDMSLFASKDKMVEVNKSLKRRSSRLSRLVLHLRGATSGSGLMKLRYYPLFAD